jgi:hypothetical protein
MSCSVFSVRKSFSPPSTLFQSIQSLSPCRCDSMIGPKIPLIIGSKDCRGEKLGSERDDKGIDQDT